MPRDWRAHAKQLGTFFPASAAGIEAFFRDAHAVFDGMYSTGVNNGGIPGPIYAVDELLAFPKRYPLAARWMSRPFAEFLAAYVARGETAAGAVRAGVASARALLAARLESERG